MNYTPLPEELIVDPLVGAAKCWTIRDIAYLHEHHASQLGICPRHRWCKFARLSPVHETSPENGIVMNWGVLGETVVERLIRGVGWKIVAKQRRVLYHPPSMPDVEISTTCDFKIIHPMLGEVGLEMKTVGSRSYDYIRKFGPKSTHIAQVHGYMAAHNARTWLLLYLPRDRAAGAPPMLCYEIHWDGTVWQGCLDEVALIETACANKRPPTRCSSGDQAWMCKALYCEWYEPGFQGDDALISLIKAGPLGGFRPRQGESYKEQQARNQEIQNARRAVAGRVLSSQPPTDAPKVIGWVPREPVTAGPSPEAPTGEEGMDSKGRTSGVGAPGSGEAGGPDTPPFPTAGGTP